MLIDWFTVAAQALNFIVLIWLLKRFLFGPITKTIEQRQKAINDTLSEAAAAKLEAQEKHRALDREKSETAQVRDRLIKEATAAAQLERERLLAEAAQAAETLSKNRLDALRNQEEKLRANLRRHAQEEAISLARDILRRLASVDLEQHTIEIFLRRLSQLDRSAKQTILQALEASRGHLLVRSAIELPHDSREFLRSGVEAALSRTFSWSYESRSDLITGFELVTDGYKIGWSGAELLEQVRLAAAVPTPGGSL